ncbi:MAG TPA: prolipoprotein diacylglyceryl transferase [Pseudomonadota bacterium]|jgi:phosphatidylglycerol:prolipoprotein diacylglycerol transferase|nr:prolipoprotein diacylglyceryl transferase [Pseudomonadota bacterium]
MPYVHDIDPIVLGLGPLAIHWYGIMYLCGLGAAWWIGRSRVRAGRFGISEQQFSDLIFEAMLGVILGGRIGYMLVYGRAELAADPFSLFRVWEGGMSFHGGLVGVMVALAWWSRRHRRHAFDTIDFIAPLVPLGLGFGRIGNWIGGELWGRHTDVPWGVIFPKAIEHLGLSLDEIKAQAAQGLLNHEMRHPSQLYQAFLEGVLLGGVMLWFTRRERPRYAASGVFALVYGLGRFVVEFAREPDAHMGYIAFGWMTTGQALSLPLIAVGLMFLFLAYRRRSA